MAQPDPSHTPQADQAPGCLHPRESYQLIGHKEAERRFIGSITSGRLHHAWLLTGPKGIGKATLAYRMIRRLLGGVPHLPESLDISPDDPISQRIESLGHGDFFLLRRPFDFKTKKLRSEIPVSETRKLSDFFAHKPAEGGWRICLVDTMDEMNRNAENAILKSLEEPPERTILILLSNRPGRLLPTIRSRCLHMPLRPVSTDEIYDWLATQNVDMAEPIRKLAVDLSEGAPGKALAYVLNGEAVLEPLEMFLKSLGTNDRGFDHKLAIKLSAKGEEGARHLFWEALQSIIRAQAVYVETGIWPFSFEPLPLQKSANDWYGLWKQSEQLRDREAAINMDKKSVLQMTLTSMRAA